MSRKHGYQKAITETDMSIAYFVPYLSHLLVHSSLST